MPTVFQLRKPIVLLAAGVGFGAIGVSVARVPGAAEDARSALESAKVAIQDGDRDGAAAAVERARESTDKVQLGMQGPAGLVGQWLPVVGTSVRDARHLGNALDAVTTVAELGAETYPEITGDQSTFFTDGKVDIPTLKRLVDNAIEADRQLGEASSNLSEIDASGPGAARFGSVRDEALAKITPLRASLDRTMPLVRKLPDLLGADGERKYLVAILNPAELRYSGGSPLTLTPITVTDGRIDFGEATDTESNHAAFQPRYWRKVKGNPFHRDRERVVNATIPPSWPIAGEETLNAWRSLRGRNMAGLLAVDVVTLARLAEITGPMDVPNYGTVDASNLVETLVGSYDRFTDVSQRKASNRALVSLFVDRLTSAGQLPDKVKVLADSAQGRHFAAYFRDKEIQSTLADFALSGDLSQTKNDYLGVFTQNVGASKTDYWQSRQVRSDVRLRPDGGAHVELTVEIHNDTPPYVGSEPDYGHNYQTRFATISIGNFLPRGARVGAASVDGKAIAFHVGDYFGRPFVRQTIRFDPQERHTMRLEYDVPAAAARKGTALTYHLDVDPQGMVRPEAVSTRVQFPADFSIASLPEGWQAAGPHAATWSVDALDESPRLELTAERTGGTP